MIVGGKRPRLRHFRVSASRCIPSKEEAQKLTKCANEPMIHPQRDCFMRELSSEHISGGAFREAYDFHFGRCVVKAGTPYMNKMEFDMTENIPEELEDVVIPIVAAAPDYSWVIMPKAEVGINMDKDERNKVEDRLFRKLVEKKMVCSDLHPGNWGMLENKPAILDYPRAECGVKGRIEGWAIEPEE